jgi:drug/metabolite transporter (DMT)-like permease
LDRVAYNLQLMAASPFGALLALLSAVFYGAGDFSGGLATRRASPYQVLAVSSAIAAGLMTLLAFATGESWPSSAAWLWSILAGLSGAAGLAALYKGLSAGRAAVVSPVSGVIAAVLPVVVAGLTQGLPSNFQLAGFAIALPGIWLVSSSAAGESKKTNLQALGLGMLAGVAFGLFFIFLARVPKGNLFGPMAAAKGAALAGALVFIAGMRQPFPRIRGNPAVLLAGILDPTANALYLLATSYTRLDIAAVLSSLYPAVTVLCSLLFLKEKIGRSQWVGLALSVAAIAMITS